MYHEAESNTLSPEVVSVLQQELTQYVATLPDQLKRKYRDAIAESDARGLLELVNEIQRVVDFFNREEGDSNEGAKHKTLRDRLLTWIHSMEVLA